MSIVGRIFSTLFTFIVSVIAGAYIILRTVIVSTVKAGKDGSISAEEQRKIEHDAFAAYWGLLKKLHVLKIDDQ